MVKPDKYLRYFNNLQEEGVPNGDAIVAVMDKAKTENPNGRWVISGTKGEFELFTYGFHPDKKERVRKIWEFTDG